MLAPQACESRGERCRQKEKRVHVPTLRRVWRFPKLWAFLGQSYIVDVRVADETAARQIARPSFGGFSETTPAPNLGPPMCVICGTDLASTREELRTDRSFPPPPPPQSTRNSRGRLVAQQGNSPSRRQSKLSPMSRPQTSPLDQSPQPPPGVADSDSSRRTVLVALFLGCAVALPDRDQELCALAAELEAKPASGRSLAEAVPPFGNPTFVTESPVRTHSSKAHGWYTTMAPCVLLR